MAANHTSIADIAACFCLFRQFKWVSKAEIFTWPVLGWNMRMCRYIPLVRGETDSARRMMQTCLYWLGRGISVCMFPEGSRSVDGQLKPFKRGAFAMALGAGVPVVPIAIHGGSTLIRKKSLLFGGTGLLVEVLEPVPCEGFTDADVYAEAVRQRIARALARSESEIHSLETTARRTAS